ncbi:hypothetical protein HXX76_002817 [Chlamydomonas incerta]|uniref:Serine aminopeptidase S33 domain-containing protein n=1 Tax=Chlamydomonas incerta TaxID=51695 RepID=A0A835W7V5_CHLIN|nr:hypothetical protein HXX76_002817 [Chlamydomonas incerta]|eukprot:KAG2442735.1 hypothetical protein HXX76_002817 [Chlamydomonas incerta]
MPASAAAGAAPGAAAAAASHVTCAPPQLEDLPLRFLSRHPTAPRLHQAGPSNGSGGGGAAEQQEAWRIAYRHWLPPPPPPPPQEEATGVAAGPSSGSEEGAQQQPHTCVLFCNGLKSEMTGSKVRCALQEAAAAGCEFLCFDYSGFGASTGRAFESCGLTDWIEDAEALLREVVVAPRVMLLGSSIGGWVALRVAQRSETCRPAAADTRHGRSSGGSSQPGRASCSSSGPRIAGLLLVAPAVDLSELRWAALTQQQRDTVTAAAAGAGGSTAAGVAGGGGGGGLVSLGSQYQMRGGDWVGAAYFTQGRQHLLLTLPWGSAAGLCGVQQRQQQQGQGQEPQQLGLVAAAGVDVAWRRPLAVPVPVAGPVLIMAGSRDEVVPLALVRALAEGISASAAAAASSLAAAANLAAAQRAAPHLGEAKRGRQQCGQDHVVMADGAAADEGAPGDGQPREGARPRAVALVTPATMAAGCELHVVEGGDHRLSDTAGLEVLRTLLGRLLPASPGRISC